MHGPSTADMEILRIWLSPALDDVLNLEASKILKFWSVREPQSSRAIMPAFFFFSTDACLCSLAGEPFPYHRPSGHTDSKCKGFFSRIIKSSWGFINCFICQELFMLTWHLEWIILIKQKLRKLLKSHQKVPAVYQKRRHSISYKLKRKEITRLYGCLQWDKWVQGECLLALLLMLLCWAIFLFPPPREFREGISKDCFPRTRSPFISPVTSPPYMVHPLSQSKCKSIQGLS